MPVSFLLSLALLCLHALALSAASVFVSDQYHAALADLADSDYEQVIAQYEQFTRAGDEETAAYFRRLFDFRSAIHADRDLGLIRKSVTQVSSLWLRHPAEPLVMVLNAAYAVPSFGYGSYARHAVLIHGLVGVVPEGPERDFMQLVWAGLFFGMANDFLFEREQEVLGGAERDFDRRAYLFSFNSARPAESDLNLWLNVLEKQALSGVANNAAWARAHQQLVTRAKASDYHYRSLSDVEIAGGLRALMPRYLSMYAARENPAATFPAARAVGTERVEGAGNPQGVQGDGNQGVPLQDMHQLLRVVDDWDAHLAWIDRLFEAAPDPHAPPEEYPLLQFVQGEPSITVRQAAAYYALRVAGRVIGISENIGARVLALVGQDQSPDRRVRGRSQALIGWAHRINGSEQEAGMAFATAERLGAGDVVERAKKAPVWVIQQREKN